MWLDRLKVAIVQQDTHLLEELLDDIPHLQTKEELDSAVVLIEQAVAMVKRLQDETAESMQQIKKTKEFVTSTLRQKKHKFDTHS